MSVNIFQACMKMLEEGQIDENSVREFCSDGE